MSSSVTHSDTSENDPNRRMSRAMLYSSVNQRACAGS